MNPNEIEKVYFPVDLQIENYDTYTRCKKCLIKIKTEMYIYGKKNEKTLLKYICKICSESPCTKMPTYMYHKCLSEGYTVCRDCKKMKIYSAFEYCTECCTKRTYCKSCRVYRLNDNYENHLKSHSHLIKFKP
jgi:hypothetical protein